MKYKYHGVRGSRTTPFTIKNLSQVFSHILLELGIDTVSTVEKNIKKKIESSKKGETENEKTLLAEYFRDVLYEMNTSYLGMGTNTPCLEVKGECTRKEQIIFDLGTGAANIEIFPETKTIHVFFTHFHYDHIQGFPFFWILYNPNIEVHFYSPFDGFQTIVEEYMNPPYFPVTMEKMTKNRHFHVLKNHENLKIGDLTISFQPINHPGGCFSYKIVDKKKKAFCLFSDVNITSDLFKPSVEYKKYLSNIDKIALDCAMSFEDSVTKKYFGHSSFYLGIDFAVAWKVKSVDIFHLDPINNITDIPAMYQVAQWYKKVTKSPIDINIAEEGKWFTL